MKPLLDVQNLAVTFAAAAGEVSAVSNVSFQIFPGEALGIVGESGCGKSVTAHSLMRLVPVPPGRYTAGRILFDGRDLLTLSEKELEAIRGNQISMIFQDPMTSLNPVLTVGSQIAEALRLHKQASQETAYRETVSLLAQVGIPSPGERFGNYPHEFSGGMRQRAMIAMALACEPRLLIADEPTTALDVTIQAQILDLLQELKNRNTSILLISHDLGVIARLCSRVIVMYAGCIAEAGTAEEIFHSPRHPYTWGLLRALPRLNAAKGSRLVSIAGQPPDLANLPTGCPFHPRCPHAMQICMAEYPELSPITPGHSVHCWLQHPDAPPVDREAIL